LFPANGGSQVVVQRLDPVQDVKVAILLPGPNPLSRKFPPAFIQDDAFDLRAAQVYADSKHGINPDIP
jgi:hypothetical protein